MGFGIGWAMNNEQKLTDILLKAAESLGQKGKVPKEVWRDMKRTQKLLKRSLKSKLMVG